MPDFNEEQKKAIMFGNGPALLLAGPGSGKTTVITNRIQYLIQKHGIDPTHILVITFSKAAATEMQQRFHRLTKTYQPVIFGTFHAISFQILKSIYHYNNSNIITNMQKRKFLEHIISESRLNLHNDYETIDAILHKIAERKNGVKQLQFEIMEKEDFDEIYTAYNQMIHENRKIDFEDMLLQCIRILKENDALRLLYQEKFQYLLVDEYQDINSVQNELIKLLAGRRKNLFVVGDDDQSIYGFRGASPKIMLHFMQEYPEVCKMYLPYNYRSDPNIVLFADELIRHNRDRYDKQFKAEKKPQEQVLVCGYRDREQQYQELIKMLREKMENKTLNDTACLFRTNADAMYLSQYLLKEKIPYKMVEKPCNPYSHFIYQDIYHYLRLCEDYPSFQRGDCYAIMNKPVRYLKRDALHQNICNFKEMIKYYQNNEYMQSVVKRFEYDINKMRQMDLYSKVNYIRKAIGYDDYLRTYALEQQKPCLDYEKMMEEIQEHMRLFQSLKELEYNMESYSEQMSRSCQKEKEGVAVMTFHASKGLEFQTVYIPDCNEGIIPHNKSAALEAIEEERRMFYVAVTRAKEELCISYVDYGHQKKHMPSRFLSTKKEPYKMILSR